MQHHVFLSYSRKDSDIMERVRDDLRAAGLMVWTDEYLEPGTPVWEAEIEKAIKDSQSLVVILSPDAYLSVWVRREITLADELNRRIFPFLIRGEKESEAVPLRLMASQWIDARRNYPVAGQQLVEGVYQHLEAQQKQQVRGKNTRGIPRYSDVKRPKGTSTTLRDIPISLPVTDSLHPRRPVKDKEKVESLQPSKTSEQELTPWNPLNQLRFLYWLFVRPNQFVDYRSKVSEESFSHIRWWTASTLTWLPWLIFGWFMPLYGVSVFFFQLIAWFLCGRIGSSSRKHKGTWIILVGILPGILWSGLATNVIAFSLQTRSEAAHVHLVNKINVAGFALLHWILVIGISLSSFSN